MKLAAVNATDWQIPRPVLSVARGRFFTGSRPATLDRLCAAFFALFILAAAGMALFVPERDWDLAAYVALAIEDRFDKPEALHAATWEIVRQNTSDKEFTVLTSAGEYRRAQFADASNFHSQLPMYRVKVGYVALVKALAPILGPVAAIQAINAASVLLLGGCLLFAMQRGGFLRGALFLVPLMMLSGFVLMARLGTPDMLAAALIVAGTMLLCSRMAWTAAPVLLAAVLVRPDTIIFLFALVLAALAFQWRLLPALTAFVLAVPLSITAGHIGWWPHFWFSTVEMQANMEGFRPAFSVAAYLTGLASGLAISMIKYNWPAVVALLLLGAWLVVRERRDIPKDIAMPMLAMMLAVGGKFVAFPMPYDRIYAVHLWLFAVSLLALWRPQLVPAASAREETQSDDAIRLG